MSRAARRSLVAAVTVLAVAGVLEQARDASRLRSQLAPTSFGTTGVGHAAFFDLLTELAVPVARNYAPPADLPARTTVWWIEPAELCADAPDVDETEEHGKLRAWIEAGGTAVLLLSGEAGVECGYFAGVRLPIPEGTVTTAPAPPPAERGPKEATAHHGQDGALIVQLVTGSIVGGQRAVSTGGLATFSEAKDWRVMAAIDGRPFIIEQSLGAGRLVLVADAAFVRNAFLDHADAAPLAMDLVRAYGAPLLDERGHGLRAYRSAVAYLARSRAWPLFVGLALLALLIGWRGNAVPPLTVRAPQMPAPTLETFVDSMATLYARTRDYARVSSRYRELTADRLRRHFGLPAETPLAVLADRLRVDSRVTPAALRTLVEGAPVSGDAELRATVRLLDSLVPRKSTAE